MGDRDEALTFSLLGGPLHRLGRRLGLVRDTNTVPLGLALGVGLWIAIVALAYLGGGGDRLWSMTMIGGHARLLLVIPLFFIAESWVAPQMTAFVRSIAGSSVVPPAVHPLLRAEVARANRWTNAWWPEAVCVLATVTVQAAGNRLQTIGVTAGADPTQTAAAAQLYAVVGLAVFRFLMFRWLWKLWVWAFFLWRVSRLDLRLIPGHPDGAGGLGFVQPVHERFIPLVAALSVVVGASLAEDIASGAMQLAAASSWMAGVVVVDAVLFVGPLLVFTDKLWASRTAGMIDYMTLAGRYVTEFERKWLASEEGRSRDSLMSTQDFSSMTDLASSIGQVRDMRYVLFGPRLLTQIAGAALIPLAPLLLFEYPLAELAQVFFSRLVGL